MEKNLNRPKERAVPWIIEVIISDKTFDKLHKKAMSNTSQYFGGKEAIKGKIAKIFNPHGERSVHLRRRCGYCGK